MNDVSDLDANSLQAALNRNAAIIEEWSQLNMSRSRGLVTEQTEQRVMHLREQLSASVTLLASLADAGGQPIEVQPTQIMAALPAEAAPDRLRAACESALQQQTMMQHAQLGSEMHPGHMPNHQMRQSNTYNQPHPMRELTPSGGMMQPQNRGQEPQSAPAMREAQEQPTYVMTPNGPMQVFPHQQMMPVPQHENFSQVAHPHMHGMTGGSNTVGTMGAGMVPDHYGHSNPSTYGNQFGAPPTSAAGGYPQNYAYMQATPSQQYMPNMEHGFM